MIYGFVLKRPAVFSDLIHWFFNFFCDFVVVVQRFLDDLRWLFVIDYNIFLFVFWLICFDSLRSCPFEVFGGVSAGFMWVLRWFLYLFECLVSSIINFDGASCFLLNGETLSWALHMVSNREWWSILNSSPCIFASTQSSEAWCSFSAFFGRSWVLVVELFFYLEFWQPLPVRLWIYDIHVPYFHFPIICSETWSFDEAEPQHMRGVDSVSCTGWTRFLYIGLSKGFAKCPFRTMLE